MERIIYLDQYELPDGQIAWLAEFNGDLCLCCTESCRKLTRFKRKIAVTFGAAFREERTVVLKRAESELDEYFAGKLKAFSLKLNPCGTAFQKSVWEFLKTIPYGKTLSYQDEARQMGNDKLTRAVASANGANPIMIFIPCHRVISKSGELGGFSGKLELKRFLLDLEGRSEGSFLLHR